MPDTPLHDLDFYTWTRRQADALRALASGRGSNEVDWENVIEEIESLGSEQRHALESHLGNVLSHLLKLQVSPALPPRQHWQLEVGQQRLRFERRLEMNPGLKSQLPSIFADAYAFARKEAALHLRRDGLKLTDLPEACPYTLEQARDMDWFPPWAAEPEGMKD